MSAALRVGLQRVLCDAPMLTIHGFGEYNEPHRATAEGRLLLLDAVDEVERALTWLATQDRCQRVNRRNSSYGLKHVAERASGSYISNGAFIAACMMSGWIVQRCNASSPNAWINITRRSIRNARPRDDDRDGAARKADFRIPHHKKVQL